MATYVARHAVVTPKTGIRMPLPHRLLSAAVTACALVVSVTTMAVGGTAAPSGAAAATSSPRPSDSGSIRSTLAAAAERPAAERPAVDTSSDTRVSPASEVVVEDGVSAHEVAAAPAVATSSKVRVSADVSPLAADGIPVTAVHAYRDAAAALATTDPGCGIPWPLLAGIGRVESDHGRFAGATLFTNGTSSTKILGPVLQGRGTAVIRDTDRGALDGNAEYDRAMGPLQFIPSTWARYASDGNHDGVQDPFNIFDESLAAAKYLCAAGGNLATTAGQVRAVYAYNHVNSYVDTVLALEHAYASGAGVVVPDPPARAHRATTHRATTHRATTHRATTKPVGTKHGPTTTLPVKARPVITPSAPRPSTTPPPTTPPQPASVTCPAGTQPASVTSQLTTASVPGSATTAAAQHTADTPAVPVGCILDPVPTPASTSAG